MQSRCLAKSASCVQFLIQFRFIQYRVVDICVTLMLSGDCHIENSFIFLTFIFYWAYVYNVLNLFAQFLSRITAVEI